MPLVVPGINNTGGDDQTQNWMSKLAGKKITDSGKSDETSFAKNELPQKHRIIKDDTMSTMDFNPDRLNVHVDKDNIVKKVTHG